jgi:hypothetical protein
MYYRGAAAAIVVYDITQAVRAPQCYVSDARAPTHESLAPFPVRKLTSCRFLVCAQESLAVAQKW